MATSEDPVPKQPGRLRSAIHVLFGQRVTPLQIQAEWIEYKQIFNDQLERLSAYLARSAKAEKARLARIQEDLGDARGEDFRAPASHRDARKAELRHRVAAAMAGPRIPGRPVTHDVEVEA